MATCENLCRYFGHCFGPQFHYLWASIPVVLFAYGYVSGMAMQFFPDLLTVLFLVAFPFVVVVHWILHGSFHRFGIPSVFSMVNRINHMYKNGTLLQGRPIAEYDQLLKDLTKLPILRMTTSLLDVAVFLIPAASYEIAVRGFGNLFAYLQAIAASIPHLMFFSYFTADLHFFRSRSEVRRKIYHLGGSPGHYYVFSLRRKLIIILLLTALSGYLLISLMAQKNIAEGHILQNVLFYAIVAFFNFALLMAMFLYNIYQSIYSLEKMSQSLRAGRQSETFTGTADKELARLSDGLFSAAERLLRQNRMLEIMVERRTRELKEANERLKQQQEILELELSMASEIQQLMNAEIPRKVGDYELYFYAMPSSKVSGDVCGVVETSEKIYLFLGDVSGHGVPAALVSMIAKQVFQSAVQDNPPLSLLCHRINHLLLKEMKTSAYMTAFFLALSRSADVEYCNAGHTRALCVRKDNTVEFLDTPGLLLGAMELNEEIFAPGKLTLCKGDVLFVYSDGISECENPEKEFFGEERLSYFLLKSRHLPPEDFAQSIMEELRLFRGNQPFADDISFLLVKPQA